MKLRHIETGEIRTVLLHKLDSFYATRDPLEWEEIDE